MAQEVVIQINVEGIDSVDEATQSIEGLTKSIEEAQQTSSGGIGDIVTPNDTQKIDNFEKKLVSTRDVMKTSQATARLLTGSIQITSAAFATFGIQNEEVTKTLLRVQTAAQLAGGIKDFARGVSGLATATKLATTAQLGFNAAVLANPYVLAAAAIAALVIGIVAFASSTDEATVSQESFESALNTTNRTLDAQKRNLDAVKFSLQQNEQAVANQIALLKAQGASTEEISKKEEELARLRIKNSVQIVSDTKDSLIALTGLQLDATDAQLKSVFDAKTKIEFEYLQSIEGADKAAKFLEDREKQKNDLFTTLAQARANSTQAQADLDILLAQRVTDANKRALDAQQKAKDDKAKKDAKEKTDAEKAEKERERIRKQTTDNILKDIETESKAITENNNKQLDVLKQNLIDGKITQETFNAEKVLLDKKTNDEIIKFRDNFQLTELQQFIIGGENEKTIRQKNGEEVIKLQRSNADIELGIVKGNEKEKADAIAEGENARIETFEREYLNKKIDLLNNELLNEEQLADALKQLELQKSKDRLDTLIVGSSEYLALKAQIIEEELALDKKKTDEQIKLDKEVQDAALELGLATFNSLSTLSDIYFNNRIAQAKGNQKEEERLAKKQFQINKALQLGVAVLNGVNSILAITSVPDFTLGVASALRIGAQVALNAASVAKILSTKFESGASSAGAASSPSIPSVNVSGSISPQTFQPDTFGTGISQQQTFGGSGVGGGNVMRAYVTESDITSTNLRLNSIRNASEL
jgi:hypothetical protein